ncbi:MAG: LicD family protein [Thermincola sp.]|jgi:lipopolysaccharide cholinephosphotransferase|nr:LicD family protein [Thermincola sp.]
MININVRKLQLLQLDAFKEVDRICKRNNLKYFMIGGTLLGAVRHKGFIPWDMDLDIAMYREDYDRFAECCGRELSGKYFLQSFKTDVDFFPALSRICINNTYLEIERSRHLHHHKGIYIDIFPLDNVSDDKRARNRQKKILALIDNIILLKACYSYDIEFFSLKYVIKKLFTILLKPLRLKWLHKMREKVMVQDAKEDTGLVCSTASHYGYSKQVLNREIYGSPVLMEFEDGLYYAPRKWEEYLRILYGDYMKLPPLEERTAMENVYKKIVFDCELEGMRQHVDPCEMAI